MRQILQKIGIGLTGTGMTKIFRSILDEVKRKQNINKPQRSITMANSIDNGCRQQGAQVVFSHSHINPEYITHITLEHVFNFKNRIMLQPAFIPREDLNLVQVMAQFETLKQQDIILNVPKAFSLVAAEFMSTKEN